MSFRRPLRMNEGSYFVEITSVDLVSYSEGKEALKLTVKTLEGDIIYGKFLIFTNNSYIVNKLIDIAYEEQPNDEIDEQKFVGVLIEIILREKNGYLNIVDISPIEYEEDE